MSINQKELYIDSINDIKDIIENSDGSIEIIYNNYKSKSGNRLVEASWLEVPHFSKKGVKLDPAVYKKQTIAKNGKQYFAQTEECVGGDTIINTLQYNDVSMEELFEKDIYI